MKIQKFKHIAVQVGKRKTIQIAAIVGLFGILGFLSLHASHAATLTVATEAEAGVLTGNYTQAPDNNASGNTAIRFGSAGPVATGLDIGTFGAKGDGVTDDTAALQRAFDTVAPGQILQLMPGKTYKHTNVLIIQRDGIHLIGPGTLLSANPNQNAVRIRGANVTIENMLVKTIGATARLTAPWQANINVDHAVGTTLRGITMQDSAQNGIFNQGGSNFLFENVTVEHSLADCIHNTGGAHDGIIRNSVSRNCGDDGVAIVSYTNDGVICHDITIESPKLIGQTHGRGMTVVGGYNITWKNIYIQDSSSAALFINAEAGVRFTYGTNNIKVLGGTIINANRAASVPDGGGMVGETPKIVKHGAIFIEAANPGMVNSNIDIEDLTIKDTDPGAGRQVAITTASGSNTQRVQLKNITITGGPTTLLNTAGTDPAQYNSIGWTFNGAPVADHVGFTP